MNREWVTESGGAKDQGGKPRPLLVPLSFYWAVRCEGGFPCDVSLDQILTGAISLLEYRELESSKAMSLYLQLARHCGSHPLTFTTLDVASVLEFGARKYEDHNWAKGLPLSAIISAVLRHLSHALDGEEEDPESGLPHLHHAGCGLMFLWAHLEYRLGTNDLEAAVPRLAR